MLLGRRKLFVILRTSSNSGSFIEVPLYYFSLGEKVGDAFHYLSVLIEELCLSSLDLTHIKYNMFKPDLTGIRILMAKHDIARHITTCRLGLEISVLQHWLVSFSAARWQEIYLLVRLWVFIFSFFQCRYFGSQYPLRITINFDCIIDNQCCALIKMAWRRKSLDLWNAECLAYLFCSRAKIFWLSKGTEKIIAIDHWGTVLKNKFHNYKWNENSLRQSHLLHCLLQHLS